MMKKAVSCALVCATVFLSVLVFASCSSSGGDEKEAVNPLTPTEQKAQVAVMAVNDEILEEINDSMTSYSGTGSARVAVDTPIDETVYDDEYTGTVHLTGTMTIDDETGKVTYVGTYVFDDYNYVDTDPDTGAETLFVINGTETVNLDATTTITETETAMSIKTKVSETDTGDLDVSVDDTPLSLVFDYTVKYDSYINYVMTETTYTIEYKIKGYAEGDYNGQYVYQPFEESQIVDYSDYMSKH